MRCDEAKAVLDAVADGRPADPNLLALAARAGWVARAEPQPWAAPPSAERLRELQRELKAARDEAFAKADTDDGVFTRVRELEAAVAHVRGALLDAATAEVAGPPGAEHRLTWRGQELRDELTPRLGRIAAATVDDFVAGMTALRQALAAEAAEAARVAKALSPEHLAVDEIELRALALTLAAPTGDALARAKAFGEQVKVAKALGASTADQPLLATLLTLGPPDLRRRLEDARRPTALLALATAWTLDPGADVPADADVPTALVLAGRRGLPADWRGQAAWSSQPGVAALLALSSRPDARETWAALASELARLHPGQVDLIAALLCLLDDTPAGLLDDLRLAGEAVTAAGLAVGGLENLAQAARLLVVVAIGRPGGLAPNAAASTAALAPSALAAAVPATLLGAAPAILATVDPPLHAMNRTVWRTHPAHRHGFSG